VLKIEIEESPISIEVPMEKQKIELEHKASFKKIHYSLILFLFIEVFFYLLFSEPVTAFLNNGNPLIPLPPDTVISRTARLVMIYHSLSVPFLVANTFWIMEYYPVREKWIPALKVLLVPGAFLVGINGLIFGYTRWRFFHELFYFGLFLVLLGGIVFIISAMPIPGKFPDPETNPSGSVLWGLNLEYFSLIILAVCIVVSTVMGALAALENFTGTIWGLGRPTEAFLPEAILRVTHHDTVEAYIVSHLHIQLAQSTAMVVMVGFRTSKLSGKTYRGVLLAYPVGVITISYGAWVLNHYVIWVGAGILILCTVTMAVVGMIGTSKDVMGEKYESASRFEKLKGLLRDPVKFTYYFLFIFGQVIVTITGISVGLRVDEVYRLHENIFIEYSFNVGHWHLLSVLIATILMLKAIDFFGVTGSKRKVLGWLIFVGSVVAFVGANLYMLRLPNDDTQLTLFITYAGVWFLLAGYFGGLFFVSKQFLQDRKEKRLADMVLLGEPLVQNR